MKRALAVLVLTLFLSSPAFAGVEDDDGSDWINHSSEYKSIYLHGFLAGNGATLNGAAGKLGLLTVASCTSKMLALRHCQASTPPEPPSLPVGGSPPLIIVNTGEKMGDRYAAWYNAVLAVHSDFDDLSADPAFRQRVQAQLDSLGAVAWNPTHIINEVWTYKAEKCVADLNERMLNILGRVDLTNITVGQLKDGFNEFYRDFKNRRIKIVDAVYVVKMQITGVSQEYIDNIVLWLRGGKKEGSGKLDDQNTVNKVSFP